MTPRALVFIITITEQYSKEFARIKNVKEKSIIGNHLKIYVRDNARSDSWGHKKVTSILKRSLKPLEKMLYSNETILNRKMHDVITIDLLFCGDTKMKSINNDFRNKNKTTDVLSFPLYESLRKGSDEFVMPGEAGLGDIIISRDVASRQAKDFKLTIEQEVIHLFVHGMLHLLGFDHEISEKEEEIMESLEKKILLDIRNS